MNRLVVVQRVFREVFDNEDLIISPEQTRADIEGWDSVAQVKIVVTLESELDFRFPNEEVSNVKSVGDLLTLLDKQLG
jgi:acyl carrier protein